MRLAGTASLRGQRVLVQGEFLSALDLEAGLLDAGATVAGPILTAADALALIEVGPGPKVAVLDVDLGGQMAFSRAERLLARGLLVVLMTGYNQADIPTHLCPVPHLQKPGALAQVARAVTQLVQAVRAAARTRHSAGPES